MQHVAKKIVSTSARYSNFSTYKVTPTDMKIENSQYLDQYSALIQ